MISATDKTWNSATTLYIARRLKTLANGQKIAVLDMGCGEGDILEFLLDYGYELYGYDFRERDDALRKKLAPYFGDSYENRIRFMEDERRIPFEDNSFDVVYANQVFEHIKLFDTMISECARVLKPNGVLLANFPLATCPIEGHLNIPFAHWIPPGEIRVSYLEGFYALGIRPKIKGCSAKETAIKLDKYLKNQTYYRFLNEVQCVSQIWFETIEIETKMLLDAKLDLLAVNPQNTKRLLGSIVRFFDGNILEDLITNFLNAAFCMKAPNKGGQIS